MSHHHSTTARSTPAFLAMSCAGLFATLPAMASTPVPAPAFNAADVVESTSSIVVTGQHQPEVASPKATQPLLDTPQTITVISDQVIRKQNLLTLRDVLATVPGITFGAGEGGGGYGDSINLRGYSANNDLTQDGVRDSAQYSRTDPFNTQQIEVYNGANSAYNGSGSVGGTINLVSKKPKPDTLTILEAGIGTDNYYRTTVDTNQRLSDLIAVRLNGVYHHNDIPGRDIEKNERWGIAPSLTIGIDSPTSLTLSYVHQEDANTPVFGVPYVMNEINDGPLPGVDSENYYGIANLDKQDSVIDRASAEFSHQFSEAVSIRSMTRWQRVSQVSWTSAPQGIFCLGNGLQPITATATAVVGAACPAGMTPGSYRPSGPRGLVRDQSNEMFYNQTDLRVVSGSKGGIRNTLVIGASFAQEDYSIENAQLLRNPGGALPNPVQPDIDLFNPDTNWTGPINYILTGRSRGDTLNRAIYAFDTLELGIIELNAGVRYEKARGIFRADTYSTPETGSVYVRGVDQRNEESVFSYRFGALLKPAENISLYASYANAKTPSSATVRLGCGVPAAPGAADPCAVAPETARNYEIGAKADVLGGRLQLTAAVFRNERSNFRVASNDPTLPSALQVLDGKSRVDGVALGATGNLTPNLSIFANYTYLDGTVRQSVSDFCLSNPSAACANSLAVPDPQAGQEMLQTPKHSGSILTSYRFPFGLEVGYGLTYQGSFALTNRVAAKLVQFRSEDYLTHRAFLSYNFNNGLTAQLNVQNLTNEKYYTGIRNNIAATGIVSGGWATPGEARSARLSLFYSF